MKFKLVLVAILFGSLSSLSAEKLTVTSFGGDYGDAQESHMIKPFEVATGVDVLFDNYDGGVDELKAQVESGNIKWDVVDIEYIDIERACSEGLLEEYSHKTLADGDDGSSYKDDFIDNSLHECGAGVIIWSIIFAYNSDNMKGSPSTIKDLFNTKKYAGKRAFRKRPQVNLEWALLADGVAIKDVYKVLATKKGQDRAFKKLSSIKKDIIWFDSWSQAPQLLNDKSAVFVQSANGRIFGAIQNENKPFEIVWDGQVYDFDGWAIVKGSKNKKLAEKFIRYATSTIPLSGMPDVAYGPTRKSSSKFVPKDVIPHLPSSHTEQGFKADAGFWADYGATLEEKFNAWVLK